MQTSMELTDDAQYLALESALNDLHNLSLGLESEQKLTLSLALEAERLAPEAGVLNLHFSSQAAATKYQLAMESMSQRLWQLLFTVVAGLFYRTNKFISTLYMVMAGAVEIYGSEALDKMVVNAVARARQWKMIDELFHKASDLFKGGQRIDSLDKFVEAYIKTDDGAGSNIAKLLTTQDPLIQDILSAGPYFTITRQAEPVAEHAVHALHEVALNLQTISAAIEELAKAGALKDTRKLTTIKSTAGTWDAFPRGGGYADVAKTIGQVREKVHMNTSLAKKSISFTKLTQLFATSKLVEAVKGMLSAVADGHAPFKKVQEEADRLRKQLEVLTKQGSDAQSAEAGQAISQALQACQREIVGIGLFFQEIKRCASTWESMEYRIQHVEAAVMGLVNSHFNDSQHSADAQALLDELRRHMKKK